MMQIESDPSSNIIYTYSSGKVSKEDMQRVLPFVKEKIEKYGKARWYYEMEDFEGWELGGFWEDLKFDLKHANEFDKIAMVGEKKWQEWMTKMMNPFTTATVKYFDLEDREEAKKWIRS